MLQVHLKGHFVPTHHAAAYWRRRAKAGAEGKLFGSIGTADIAEAAVKAGQPITRAEVRMPTGPIRATGEHQVQLHLHADVDVALTVTITAEE